MTFVDGYLGGQEDKVVGRKKEILVEPPAGAGRPKTVAAVYRLENRGKIAVLNIPGYNYTKGLPAGGIF